MFNNNPECPETNALVTTTFANSNSLLLRHWQEGNVNDREPWPQALAAALNMILPAPFPMAIFWGDDCRLFFNNAFGRLIASATSYSCMQGSQGLELWPEAWTTFKPGIEKVQKEGSASTGIDQRFTARRNGHTETIFLTYSLSPVLDDNGQTTGVLLSCQNTTASCQKISKLEEANNRFLHMAMRAPVAIAVFRGPDFIAEMANDGYLPLVGKTKAEFIGKPLLQVVPQARDVVQPILSEVMRTGLPHQARECRIMISKNGLDEPGYFDFTCEPLHKDDGSIEGIIVFAHEVTSQVRARRQLRETKELLELTLEKVPASIYLFGAQGKLLLSNDKAGQDISKFITDHQPTEINIKVLWQAIMDLMVLHKEDGSELPADEFPVNVSFRHGKAAEIITRCTNKKTNAINWSLIKSTPLFDENGKVNMVLVAKTDITRQKLAEATIRESEVRFRSTFENAAVGIAQVAPDGGLLLVNQRFCDIVGYTKQELEENSFQNITYPDDLYADLSLVQQLLEGTRNTYSLEKRYIHKNGSKVWVNLTVALVRNELGQPQYFISVIEDITTRKIAEAHLKEHEEQLRIALEGGELGYFDFNLTTSKLYWSARTKELFGLPLDKEATYADFLNSLHPEDRTGLESPLPPEAIIQNEGRYEYEYRILNLSDGRLRWVKSTGKYFFDQTGKPFRLSGVVQDITEQKRSEALIRESEEQFRTLAETLPQLIGIADGKGQPLYTSGRWEQYTGIKNLGLESWKQIVHADDWDRMKQAWNNGMKSKVSLQPEIRLKHNAGIYRWNKVHLEPIKNDRSDVVRWVGAFTDIHDQKTFSEKLEQLVDLRTLELQRSNEDLQQFAHVASHDLKEPVRKIKTFISRFESVLAEQLNPEGKRYLDKIQSAANRMMVMIDGVLNYSTLNATEQEYEPVDIGHVIRQIESDLELVIHHKGAQIHVHHLPVITAAPVLIHQLFYNLIFNSLKFSRNHVPPVISLSSEVIDRGGHTFFSIRVQDNGIGFDQQYADQIFTTFTRLNSKDKYEGTGLGLALCKKIIERHGGAISASGIKDKGATFYIELPAA